MIAAISVAKLNLLLISFQTSYSWSRWSSTAFLNQGALGVLSDFTRGAVKKYSHTITLIKLTHANHYCSHTSSTLPPILIPMSECQRSGQYARHK